MSDVKLTSREAWLAERRKGLFSSDAAAICGRSPWRTAWEVFLDKTGQLPESEPSELMLLGLELEPVIANLYQQKTGASLIEPGLRWHPKVPWLGANCDRLASDRIVELKFAASGRGWGEEETDEIPQHYLLQVHHQMLVMGEQLADVAVLFGYGRFRIFTVPRNEDLAESLLSLEAEFWRQHVLLKTRPEPDWSHRRTQDLVKALYPATGGAIEIHDESILETVSAYEGWQAEAAAASKYKEAAKAQLIFAMGEAAEARLPDGTLIRRPLVKRRGYTVEPTEYYGFRLDRPKILKGGT